MPTLPKDASQLDPKIVKVMSSLKKIESNGDYNAVGDNGDSHGAYQFNKDNWKNWAKQYLGDAAAPMTPANQNKLMYARIKEQKDKGLQPEEIAALHNGAHKENGKYGYNNPEYGDKFRAALGQSSSKPLQTPPEPFSFASPLENIRKGNEGANVDVAKGALKGIGGVIMDVGGADTNPVVKDMIAHGGPELQQGVIAARKAVTPSNAAEEQGAQSSYLGANLVPVGGGVKAVGATVGLIDKGLTGAKDAVLTAVSPRLTSKVAAGTKTSVEGLLKKIVPVASNYLKKTADAIRPYFKPNVSWSENAISADKAIANEANSLVNLIDRVNHPVPTRELESSLTKTKAPIALKGTPFEKQIGPLIKAAVQLSREAGGTVKGSFLALRKFDDLVEKTWPTLWDNAHAPMRNAVTAIRDEWKNFIAKNLPDEKIYRDSLEKQSLLYDARDVFREKASLGELQEQGEIGTTGIGRWAAKHPGLINNTRKAAGWATGVAATGILGGQVAGRVMNK